MTLRARASSVAPDVPAPTQQLSAALPWAPSPRLTTTERADSDAGFNHDGSRIFGEEWAWPCGILRFTATGLTDVSYAGPRPQLPSIGRSQIQPLDQGTPYHFRAGRQILL
jgi:hypothetical protein